MGSMRAGHGSVTLHPRVVRHILSPLLERMLGRGTFAHLRELQTSQWWPADRLRAVQARKLKTLLRTAQTCCPYYRRLMASGGISVEEDNSFAALARFPLLDKTTIRANLEGMINHRVPGGPVRFNTGGSTGEPLVFYVDRRRIGHDKAARMLTHAWFGAAPGHREAYLWGSPVELRAQDYLRRLRDRLTNEMLLEAFNLSPASMSRYLKQIHQFDPVSIFGYPSSLATLAEYCESTGRRFGGRRLRAVFVTGELLDAHQRQTLHRFFRAPLANCYGSRDGGFIAHECPDGRMHLFDQNLYVEIVDAAGHRLDCGQTGEIVITHLDALAMPLIRYRTGDLGCLQEEACTCGRGMTTMSMVAGRRTDHLVAADGALQHALSAIYVIRELTTVRQFQIHQHANRHVEVRVIPEAGFGLADRQHIRSGIRRQLGMNIEVEVHTVDTINPVESGKFRHVISDAAHGSAALPAIRRAKEGAL